MAELIRDLVSVLRYFAAPVVAFVAVWLLDPGHDALIAAAKLLPSSPQVPALWIASAIALVGGLVVYYAHRTLFHSTVSRLMLRVIARSRGPQPEFNDLAFARWRRRGAALNAPERAAQSVLDEANAAGHFFYCSCWSSIGVACAVEALVPDSLTLGCSFYVVLALLFAVGAISDWQTMLLDIEAYHRFKSNAGLTSEWSRRLSCRAIMLQRRAAHSGLKSRFRGYFRKSATGRRISG